MTAKEFFDVLKEVSTHGDPNKESKYSIKTLVDAVSILYLIGLFLGVAIVSFVKLATR